MDHDLRLHLLGGFRAELAEAGGDATAVVVDEERWTRSSARHLVKLLALSEGTSLHRDRVQRLLWPSAGRQAAQVSLRVALHAARRALEPGLPPRAASSYLVVQDGMVQLVPERTRVDLHEVRAAANAALAGPPTTTALAAALAALDRPLLPEDRDTPWTAPARRDQQELLRRLATALADLFRDGGEPARGVEPLAAALAADPLDEGLHRRLIRLHLDLGRRREAIRQYHACRTALRAELGVDPDVSTRALFQEAVSAPQDSVFQGLAAALPSALESPPPTPLFGRVRALRLLTADPAGTVGRLTLVSGEAGVGKTRLVAEAARAAAAKGAVVLWAAGEEGARDEPYRTVAAALDDFVTGCPPRVREALAVQYPDLAELLPGFGGGVPPLTRGPDDPHVGTPQERRDRLRADTAALLTDLAANRPVLVVLDDLHTADGPSLELVAHLLRRTAGRPVRFLGTYQEPEAGGDLERFVRATTAAGTLRQLELMRLSRADCDGYATALLGAAAPGAGPDLVERVFRASLGNPLFAHELIGAWAAEPSGSAGGSTHQVPSGLRELVVARVDRISVDVRRVLELLAALGGHGPLAELRASAALLVPPLTEEVLLTALDRAVTTRLVEDRPVGTAAGYAFRHPLVRRALYQRLSAAQRLRLHRALALALERTRPRDVDALARHFDRAEHPRAADHLRRAGDRAAALYANDAAEQYYGRLAERLDQSGDPSGAAAARVARAAVLRTAARWADSAAALAAAEGWYRDADDTEGLVRTITEGGHLHAGAGTPALGLAALLAVNDSTASAAVRAARQLVLGRLYFPLGRYPEQLAAGDTAVALGRELIATGHPAGPRTVIDGLVCRSVAQLAVGQAADGRRSLQEAATQAEPLGDAVLLATVLGNLSEACRRDGDLTGALVHRARAVTLAERIGDPSRLAFQLANLANLRLLTGDPDAAAEHAQEAVAQARSVGTSWSLAYAMLNLGEVHLRTGRTEQAEQYLAEAAEAAAASGDAQAGLRTVVLRAEAALAAGDPARAAVLLGPYTEGDAAERVSPLVGWARLETGAVDDALAAAAKGVRRAGELPDRPAEVDGLWVLGRALLAAGRPADAAAELRRAVALADAMPYPAGAARARTELAALQRP
ncbi:ATP-binding protein [Streptomyces sp. NPDC087270]|uniref:ATP-binding protein n=1 Tax=Streptomyces sp. NPDC087270 TaxID=3365774 RepID=UPI0038252FDC